MQTKDQILAEKEVYWNSVLFFAAFFGFCKREEILCLVEAKFIGQNGHPKYPDFSIFDKEILKLVFEHKGSIQKDLEQVYSLITNTKEKYDILKKNSKEFRPRIIMFFPKSCEETINKLDKNKKLADIIFQFNKDFRAEIHNVYSDNLGEVIPHIMVSISMFLEGFDKETKRSILLNILESLDTVEKKVEDFYRLSKDV